MTHTAFRSPIWVSGGCGHNRSVYQRSFLAFRNLANSNLSQEWSNGRCLFGYDFIVTAPWCAGIIISYSVRLRRCSSYWDGQCESLEKREEQRYRLSRFFFINQSVQSGRPTGHGNTIMKENKKEELQSRRSFFKNAAKAALPILGAVVLAHMPTIAKASESQSCGSCRYSCTACVGGCMDNCARNCTACSNACASGCHRSCYTGCNGKVKNYA